MANDRVVDMRKLKINKFMKTGRMALDATEENRRNRVQFWGKL